MLERKGRIKLKPDIDKWINQATDRSFCTVLPVDTELVIAQRMLSDSFHGDLADRLIVTTAIMAGIPLATHDSRILETRVSGLAIWKA
jgi:PIN domain nuclease of toxin-antitoxin system